MERIRDKLSNQITSDSSIRAIYLIPTKGEKIISAGQASESSKTVLEQSWYTELKEGDKKIMWSPTMQNSGAPYFTIARSLGSMNDLTSTYVVMFELNASVLDTRLKGINLGENGQSQ